MGRSNERSTSRNDRQTDVTPAGDKDHTGRSCDCDSSNEGTKAGPKASEISSSRLISRVLVTWIELTVVGITGGLLGTVVGGPPGFIIYLVTTLLTVGIIFYNVNELVKRWVQT